MANETAPGHKHWIERIKSLRELQNGFSFFRYNCRYCQVALRCDASISLSGKRSAIRLIMSELNAAKTGRSKFQGVLR